jgi:hypothetical protein
MRFLFVLAALFVLAVTPVRAQYLHQENVYQGCSDYTRADADRLIRFYRGVGVWAPAIAGWHRVSSQEAHIELQYHEWTSLRPRIFVHYGCHVRGPDYGRTFPHWALIGLAQRAPFMA